MDTIVGIAFFAVIAFLLLGGTIEKWGPAFGIRGFGDAGEKAKGVSKWAAAFLVGSLISLYAAFVAMCYWNWFVVRALHVENISYLEMVGIVWFVKLLQEKTEPNEEKWKVLFATIQATIPEDKREMVQEALQDYKDEMWLNAATVAFGRIVGLTVSLALGFGLSILI